MTAFRNAISPNAGDDDSEDQVPGDGPALRRVGSRPRARISRQPVRPQATGAVERGVPATRLSPRSTS